MKRSEMVKKLGARICLELGSNIGDLDTARKLADLLLKDAEDEGMKPPVTSGVIVIGRDRFGRPAAFDDGRRGHRRSAWECEDNELEQLQKELADDTWQEPED